MEPKYNHKLVEQNKTNKWIKQKIFSTHDLAKKPYSIILPPPNITGKLHLGHALNSYLQDVMIRYKKLQNFDVLWVPGLDHAGIATQIKLEQDLIAQNINPRTLSKEKLFNYASKWKKHYREIIHNQWNKLGLALDYKFERFTLEPSLNKNVNDVFISMYHKGLIYRGKRAINWDPKLQTVISNIEVVNREEPSVMYYFKYYLKNDLKNFLIVGTTRPETMYSDVAIAINPTDNNLKHLIGQIAISPLTNKELPIIGDEYVKITKGSGAMKVSAHAMVDIEIIFKHKLEVIECIDKFGKMTKIAQEFAGQDRFVARKLVVKKLIANNYFFKAEDIVSAVSVSERSQEVIEILVQPQWFVKVRPLANLLLENLNQENHVQFFPKRFVDILKSWMENAYDWTISRQLWWGHQIPAWYKGDEIKVSISSPGKGWVQDQDVLDTWFSSCLAPFSFLGWHNNENIFTRYFPTSLLVTGYDIIFFWVSKMYYQSLNLTSQKPFNQVLIHGLVRAENGQKMSKSLNNGIDPMEIIDQYGSDALRWFLLTNTTPGQDLTFSIQKIESAWNLCNKIWNIARYIYLMPRDQNQEKSNIDMWILDKLNKLINLVNAKINDYEFTVIGKELTRFIQEDFSSWYLEFTKVVPNFIIAREVLSKLCIILHPFLPFLTDHIFYLINNKELLTQNYPLIKKVEINDDIEYLISLIKVLREFKTTNQLNHKFVLHYYSEKPLSNQLKAIVTKLTNCKWKKNNDHLIAIGKNKIFVAHNKQINQNDLQILNNKLLFLEKGINRIKSLLDNQQFVTKAPQQASIERKKLQKLIDEYQTIKHKIKNSKL